MKKLIAILSIVLFLISCDKETEQPLVKGKLVYRSCATIVVQVLDPKYYSLGQGTWQSTAKTDFEHVFAVANQCSFPASVSLEQEFYFKVINDDPKNKECVRCALFDNPPTKSHLIKVVEQKNE